jgi:TPR repeat protein
MHRIGIGVPRNDIEAYAWYSVAAATGPRYATKPLAKATLTPDQLAVAQKRAAELTE